MKKTIIIVFMLSSIWSFGQIDNNIESKPFIDVTGTASKEVVPDKIFISIVLTEKVVQNAKYTIEEQEDNLKKALRKINIDLSLMSLSGASSELTTEKRRETGFKVSKEFTIMVKNASEVSDVFRELYAVNIKEASVAKTEHSKIESLRKEVRIAAIKAAKDKAEYLLAAIGGQIEKPLMIREEVYHPYDNTFSNTISNYQAPEGEQEKTETNFEKFTIRFSYFVRYSIK